MTTTRSPRRISARRVRSLQRLAHLLTGLALIAYVYVTPPPGSPAMTGVRWFVLPALVTSGLAMWQWPRLRRLVFQRGSRT